MKTFKSKHNSQSVLQSLWSKTSWIIYFRLHELPKAILNELPLSEETRKYIEYHTHYTKQIKESIKQDYTIFSTNTKFFNVLKENYPYNTDIINNTRFYPSLFTIEEKGPLHLWNKQYTATLNELKESTIHRSIIIKNSPNTEVFRWDKIMGITYIKSITD